jgi:hypothetical protein
MPCNFMALLTTAVLLVVFRYSRTLNRNFRISALLDPDIIVLRAINADLDGLSRRNELKTIVLLQIYML